MNIINKECNKAVAREAEIANVLDDIRSTRNRNGYFPKHRVTARYIREGQKAGQPTVRVGYCVLQDVLSGIDPEYYTAGTYGWNCDVYNIAGLTICTGYRPAAGIKAIGVRELAKACRDADPKMCDLLFADWIITNRKMAQAN